MDKNICMHINALKQGDTNKVIKFLSEAKKKNYIDTFLDNKWRPIHIAASNGHLEIVKLLIENKCIECEDEDKWRPIHHAASEGHLEIVKLLIENKCVIECENEYKWRPIHCAAFNGHLEIVKLLIENKCVIECEDGYKWRPIHDAVSNGHLEIVKLLIENKCVIECEDKYKWRPIHYAASKGHLEIVKLLIENKCVIECEDEYKRRPIHHAASNGHLEIVKLLIEYKCVIECETEMKSRPIHRAALNGHLEIVKLLIENICVTKWEKEAMIKSPVDLAKEYIRKDCAEYLKTFSDILDCIKQNNVIKFEKLYMSHIKQFHEKNIMFPLHVIVHNNNADKLCEYLLEKCIDDKELNYLMKVIDIIKTYENSRMIKENILYRSIRDRHAEGFNMFCTADVINGQHKWISKSFIEIIAENDCRVFLKEVLKKSIYSENEWNRAISIAQEKGYHEIAEKIKARQSMIVSRLKKEFSLLHTAVCDNDVDMVKYILDKNLADLNINHNIFGTALALAHSLYHEQCITVLEQFNADPNTQNKYHQTPLHEAIASGTFDHCDYLIEKSDDIDREGFNNLTALHCAVMEGCAELCEKLLEYNADCNRYADCTQVSKGDHCEDNHSIRILSLSSKENSLTLCLKLNRTIYPSFLKQLDYDKTNSSDSSNNSLLHLAAICLQPEVCKALLESRALINEMNKEGNTCLMELLSNTDLSIDDNNINTMIDVVNVLIEHGANVNMLTKTGRTIINYALRFNSQKLMLALLPKSSKHINQINIDEEDFKLVFTKRWFEYAEALINVMSDYNLTTFITKDIIKTSSSHAQSNLTKLLFDKADANVQQSVLEDILDMEANNDNEMLFDYLKDIEINNPQLFKNGETLLTNLIKERKVTYCLKLFQLKHVAKYINMKNNYKQLPLQIAIEMEEMDIVFRLIDKTDEVNNEYDKGETVLMQLLKKISNCDKSVEVTLLLCIRLLIDKGGDINMLTSKDQKVIDCCTKPSIRAEIEQFTQYKGRNFADIKIIEVEKKICNICSDNEVDCALIDCGHTFCIECVEKWHECPTCRSKSTKYNKIYL